MVQLMVDVHIVDGSLYNIDPAPDSLYKYGVNQYIAVFKKHHTDSVQVKRSLKYYTIHPDKLETIYADVTQILQKKLDSVNKVQLSKPATNALPKK